MAIHVDQDTPNWMPLEAVARLTPSIDLSDWMWMGEHVRPNGVAVQLYKHIDTRRYLNLDGAGHAYRYKRDFYVPYGDLAEALAHVHR